MPKYIIKKDVPILDEHTLHDEDGNPIVTFDAKKLEQIAARNNARIAKTGDLIPLVIGHTKDDADETEQPEIVGYAKDLCVKPFKKTGKKAIHAKFLFFKDKVAKARNFPRRSIELWLTDGKIDPISLLGATTPERDLGLLQLEKSGAVIQLAKGGRRKYQRLIDDQPQPKEKTNAMDEKAVVAAVMKALEQSAVWKWAEGKMKEEEAEEGEPGLGEELPGEGEDLDLEGEELPDEEGVPGEEAVEEEPEVEEEEEEGHEPVRYSAGAAAPSGSNTSTPAFGATNRNPSNMHKKSGVSNHNVQKKGHGQYGSASGTQKLSRRRDDTLVRFQKAIRKTQLENAELRLKFQRAERERDLLALAAEGYDFDPVEELDYCQQLPDDHYNYHLQRIRKRYQRAPVGDARFDLGFSRNPQPASANGNGAAQAAAIRDYALKNGISYEDAMTKFEGEQTF